MLPLASKKPPTQRARLQTGLLSVGALGVVALLGYWWIGSALPSPAGAPVPALEAVMYRSPSCGCCGGYAAHLQRQGVSLTVVELEDVVAVKNEFGVPQSMWSCHTLEVGGYFVEGHVPFEAIQALVAAQPKLDGVALPGMPAGSPGMGGEKTAPFVIYAVKDGVTQTFMTL